MTGLYHIFLMKIWLHLMKLSIELFKYLEKLTVTEDNINVDSSGREEKREPARFDFYNSLVETGRSNCMGSRVADSDTHSMEERDIAKM